MRFSFNGPRPLTAVAAVVPGGGNADANVDMTDQDARNCMPGSSGLENKGKQGRCTGVQFLGGSRREGEGFTRNSESNRRAGLVLRAPPLPPIRAASGAALGLK